MNELHPFDLRLQWVLFQQSEKIMRSCYIKQSSTGFFPLLFKTELTINGIYIHVNNWKLLGNSRNIGRLFVKPLQTLEFE